MSSNALDQQPPPDHEDGSWDQPDYDDDYGGAGDDTGPSGEHTAVKKHNARGFFIHVDRFGPSALEVQV